MQTNARLLTDRDLLRPATVVAAPAATSRRRPLLASGDGDAAAGVLEALAHAALVLILAAAFVLGGQHTAAKGNGVVPTMNATAPAPASPSPAAVAGSAPVSGTAVKHCL